jgi:hypothetical protein
MVGFCSVPWHYQTCRGRPQRWVGQVRLQLRFRMFFAKCPSVSSSQWGEYKGTLIGVSHLDLINWTNRLKWWFWELTGSKRKYASPSTTGASTRLTQRQLQCHRFLPRYSRYVLTPCKRTIMSARADIEYRHVGEKRPLREITRSATVLPTI